MTDYIEILHHAGKMRSVMVLHDQGSDVIAYLGCASSDIGEKFEARIRERFGSMCAVMTNVRLHCEKDAADDLEHFIEAAHRMCGDDESDADITDWIDMARAFVSEHVITIKDH